MEKLSPKIIEVMLKHHDAIGEMYADWWEETIEAISIPERQAEAMCDFHNWDFFWDKAEDALREGNLELMCSHVETAMNVALYTHPKKDS